MPWPMLIKCEKGTDWSYWQNDATLLHRPFDVDEFCDNHPSVRMAVVRAVDSKCAPDRHFGHYYDGFLRRGLDVAAYVWPNPTKAIAWVMEQWKRGLGDRVPKLLAQDHEETETFAGKTKAQRTDCLEETWEAAHVSFPDTTHIGYSRGNWLKDWIIVADWFHKIKWWIAHYIYPEPGVAKQASSFAVVDAMLPISNNFTPARGPILVENVIGWQFSDKGLLVPRGTLDMDYFLKSFVGPIYGEPVPVPSPKVPITIQVPKDKVDIRIVEL